VDIYAAKLKEAKPVATPAQRTPADPLPVDKVPS